MSGMTPRAPAFRRARLVASALLLGLAGCGGGVWFVVSDFDSDGDGEDGPPTVALAVSPEAARPGEVIELVAAAEDDSAVDHVAFYRLEPATGGAMLLARDSEAPYRTDVLMEFTAAMQVGFFARAVDDMGYEADSAVVGVTVVP
jgi:hypothetical protein